MRTHHFIPVLLIQWDKQRDRWHCFVKRSGRVPGSGYHFLDRARNDPLAPNLFLDPARSF